MTAADYIIAFLSRGPATRMAILGYLIGRNFTYASAETETGQALMALVKAGRVESCTGGDVWRLTERSCGAKDAQMAEETPAKAKGAGKSSGGYTNYVRPSTDDATPRMGNAITEGTTAPRTGEAST